MKLLSKIDDIYFSSSVKDRFIAKSLFWICIFVTPPFVYGLIINIVETDYLAGIIEGLFALLLIYGFFLIFKKRVKLFSSMFVFAAVIVGIVAGILGRGQSLYAAYIAFVFLIPSLVSMALLSQSVIQAVSASAIAVGGIVFSYFLKAVPMIASATGQDANVANLLMVPLFMSIIVSILSIIIVYSTGNIIGQLSISEEDSKERVNTLTGFFSSLKETINIGEDLNNSAESSLELTNTISGNLNSMEQSIENLKNQISSTQNIHESINKAGQTVRESSQNQSSAVEQSASAVEEMATSIVEMSKTAESKRDLIVQLVETEKEVSGQIKTGQKSFDLVKKSAGEMLGVVAVISDIAERTNLLAMNAAIEAAHAGSTGKGFAVVAQEIRKLAVEAGTNSQKIKDIIESSIKGIDNAVNINSRVATEFHAVTDQVQEIDGALSDIITGFSELAAGTNEITRVVENLAVINNSVQASVMEVTDQLGKGRDSVDQISHATEAIVRDMEDIAGDSRTIKAEAEKLYKIGQDNVSHIRMLEDKLS